MDENVGHVWGMSKFYFFFVACVLMDTLIIINKESTMAWEIMKIKLSSPDTVYSAIVVHFEKYLYVKHTLSSLAVYVHHLNTIFYNVVIE